MTRGVAGTNVTFSLAKILFAFASTNATFLFSGLACAGLSIKVEEVGANIGVLTIAGSLGVAFTITGTNFFGLFFGCFQPKGFRG